MIRLGSLLVCLCSMIDYAGGGAISESHWEAWLAWGSHFPWCSLGGPTSPPWGDCVKTLYHHSTLFWLQGKHSLASFVTDAKKRRRKPKSKKQESNLLQSRLSSLCLPPTLLPPPPLPPPATTMASVVAPSSPVYTMPRVFGPFPALPRKSVSGSIAPMWLWEGQPLYPCSGAPQRLSWAHSSGSQNFVYKQQNPFVDWIEWQWIKQIKRGLL